MLRLMMATLLLLAAFDAGAASPDGLALRCDACGPVPPADYPALPAADVPGFPPLPTLDPGPGLLAQRLRELDAALASQSSNSGLVATLLGGAALSGLAGAPLVLTGLLFIGFGALDAASLAAPVLTLLGLGLGLTATCITLAVLGASLEAERREERNWLVGERGKTRRELERQHESAAVRQIELMRF